MLSKMKSVKDVVERLLFEHPETRDNDRLLIVKVWAEQNPNLRSKFFSFRRFAVDFIEGKYADPESIRRTRQKAQEKYPDLRGEKYYERHKEEEAVRDCIKTM